MPEVESTQEVGDMEPCYDNEFVAAMLVISYTVLGILVIWLISRLIVLLKMVKIAIPYWMALWNGFQYVPKNKRDKIKNNLNTALYKYRIENCPLFIQWTINKFK